MRPGIIVFLSRILPQMSSLTNHRNLCVPNLFLEPTNLNITVQNTTTEMLLNAKCPPRTPAEVLMPETLKEEAFQEEKTGEDQAADPTKFR